MEYDLVSNLGNAIDNVFNYSNGEDSSRKTVAKLINDKEMSITFMSIVNVAREKDLQVQVGHINKESNHHITARLNSIKKEFKSCAGRPLKTKKIGESDSFEVITTSAFSHFKTYKVCYTKTFEVS